MIKALFDTLNDSLSTNLEGLFEKDNKLSASFGKEGSLISSYNDGLSVTGTKFLTPEKSKEHLLYFGPSGSGKSTVCLVPSALNIAKSKHYPSSMIINNPAGDFMNMEAYFLHLGYKVYCFDPNNKNRSIYYNPLARIRSKSDIHKVAKMLVSKGGNKQPDFWDLKSIELISLLIEFLHHHAPRVHQNVANVFFLLQNLAGDESVMNNLFASESTKQEWLTYRTIIANSANTKASIISSAMAHLSFIGNSPELSNITSVDTFDFSRLYSEKIVLFLNVPTMDMPYYAPILGLFFDQLFSELFRNIPKKGDSDLYLLIDELSSIPIPNLSVVISNARKYFSLLGILQSESQLTESYGENNSRTILNNATKVYMTGLNEECERISRALGEYEYYTDKEKKNTKVRALMTPSEIRQMPRDRVIVIPNGGLAPLYCKIKPFYKIRKYIRAMTMEYPEGHTPFESPDYTTQYFDLTPYRNLSKPDISEQ